MKLNIYLFIVPLLLACIACNTPKNGESTPDTAQTKQPTKAPEPTPEVEALTDITGPWLWVKTVCCGRMQRTSVDTSDVPTIVQIGSDGSYSQTHGNELQRNTTYKYSFDKSLGANVIKLDDRNMPAIVHFNGDTLLMDYGYMDLQTEYYIRFRR